MAKSVPAYAVAVGNPVEVKRYRFDETTIQKLLKIRWWDWEEDAIQAALPDMKDIAQFVIRYEVVQQ